MVIFEVLGMCSSRQFLSALSIEVRLQGFEAADRVVANLSPQRSKDTQQLLEKREYSMRGKRASEKLKLG
jgi:hypothetical protein